MSLEQQLTEDLKTAMRAKDKTALATIRSVIAGIKLLRADGKHDEITNDDVITIVNRETKKRRDAMEMYKENDRLELAEQEEAELAILLNYLPKQLGEEEINAVIAEVIAAVGASGPGDKGKVMGQLMGRLKGKADGKLINELVTKALG